MRDGEPAHLVSGVTVRTAGQEARGAATAHHAAQAGVENQVGSDAGLDVRAHVIPVIVISFDIALLAQETTGHEVTGLVITALHGDVVLVRDTGAEYLLDIVYVVPAVGGVAVEHGLDIRLGEIRLIFLFRGNGAARELVHLLRQVVVVGELGAVHESREIRVHRHADRPVIGDVRVTLVTLAGGDDDHAASSLQAVHGRGSAVLQDRNALDIGRVDVVDVVHGEAVHHIGDSINGTADAERGLVQARFAGLLDGGNAGQLTGEDLRYVRGRGLQELVALDGGHGRRQGLLLGRAIAHDDDILQIEGVFRHRDVQAGLALVRTRLGGHAQAGELQDGAVGDGQGPGAVGARHRAGGRALDEHRHPGQGLAVGVLHRPPRGLLRIDHPLSEHERGHEEDQQTG